MFSDLFLVSLDILKEFYCTKPKHWNWYCGGINVLLRYVIPVVPVIIIIIFIYVFTIITIIIIISCCCLYYHYYKQKYYVVEVYFPYFFFGSVDFNCNIVNQFSRYDKMLTRPLLLQTRPAGLRLQDKIAHLLPICEYSLNVQQLLTQ